MSEPGVTPTHPVPKTQRRDQTTERARRLWESLRDVLSNEEAWYIIDRALEENE